MPMRQCSVIAAAAAEQGPSREVGNVPVCEALADTIPATSLHKLSSVDGSQPVESPCKSPRLVPSTPLARMPSQSSVTLARAPVETPCKSHRLLASLALPCGHTAQTSRAYSLESELNTSSIKTLRSLVCKRHAVTTCNLNKYLLDRCVVLKIHPLEDGFAAASVPDTRVTPDVGCSEGSLSQSNARSAVELEDRSPAAASQRRRSLVAV